MKILTALIGLIRKVRFFVLINLVWRKYTFGRKPYIGRMVYLWAKHGISVGDYFYIGKFSQIECDAEIGDHVMLAGNVALVGRYDHHYRQIGTPTRLADQIRDKQYNWKGLYNKIVIEDDVWVGYGSIILSGVTIGQGSIVAAGSVVTKDVEPFSLYAGVPARKIGDRFEKEEDRREHLRLYNLHYKRLSPA